MITKAKAASILRLANGVPAGKQNRRGATMVEFALFFTIFFALAVGLMELGVAVWTHSTLAHAARAGARYAMVHGSLNPINDSDKSVEAVVKSNAVGLNNSDITVNTTYPTTNERGEVVQIEVSYPHRFATGSFLTGGSGIRLSSRSRMVIAN